MAGRSAVSLGCAGLVLAGLVGVAACSSSAALPQPQGAAQGRPVAQVTGFRHGSIFGLSDPVTVRITGPRASRLAQLVSQLPPAAQPDCHEPLDLIYRIALRAGPVARSTTVFDGYRCGAAVAVTAAGKAVSWRRDTTCELYDAVRQVLPGRARATQHLGVGCNSPASAAGQ